MRYAWCKIHGRYVIDTNRSVCKKPCFSPYHEYMEAVSDVRSHHVSEWDAWLFNITYYWGIRLAGSRWDTLIEERFQERLQMYRANHGDRI